MPNYKVTYIVRGIEQVEYVTAADEETAIANVKAVYPQEQVDVGSVIAGVARPAYAAPLPPYEIIFTDTAYEPT